MDVTQLSFSQLIFKSSAILDALHTSLGTIKGLGIWAIQGLLANPCIVHLVGYKIQGLHSQSEDW